MVGTATPSLPEAFLDDAVTKLAEEIVVGWTDEAFEGAGAETIAEETIEAGTIVVLVTTTGSAPTNTAASARRRSLVGIMAMEFRVRVESVWNERKDGSRRSGDSIYLALAVCYDLDHKVLL